MPKLTDENKKLIDKLHSEGYSCRDIHSQVGTVTYMAVWQYINREILKERSKKRYLSKQKQVNIPAANQKYVETGKAMPPSYKSNLTIIVDKELAELACNQMGLKPPVTTLANRPQNISHSGMKWHDNKWVPMEGVNNYG